MDHPLDRATWNALTTRLASFVTPDSDRRALRIDPDVGVFLAAADGSPESVAAMDALARRYPAAGIVERSDGPMALVAPPSAPVVQRVPLVQMVATELTRGGRDIACEPLTEADAPEMLALATLTKPGPFRIRTLDLGGYIGVRRDGSLVAMAGRRLRLDGFTELSAVCTHPDHRGRGYAAALSRLVVAEILATGDAAFLNAFAAHETSIAFYRGLGFEVRAPMTYTILGEPEGTA